MEAIICKRLSQVSPPQKSLPRWSYLGPCVWWGHLWCMVAASFPQCCSSPETKSTKQRFQIAAMPVSLKPMHAATLPVYSSLITGLQSSVPRAFPQAQSLGAGSQLAEVPEVIGLPLLPPGAAGSCNCQVKVLSRSNEVKEQGQLRGCSGLHPLMNTLLSF